MTDGMGGVAQDYASRGLAVIPLWPKAKEPAVQNGVYAATTDMEGLGQWFHDHPGFNVGIACGAASGGLVVIDLDCHGGDDGPNGWDALKEWERAHGQLPDTVTALTGSGGYHLYYRAPAGLKVGGSVNRELGVDVKSDGGYIVAPPSIHPNGRPYEWEYDLDERAIAEVDENVLGFIESARPGGASVGGGQSQRLELPETIGAGGRNDTLYRAGCSMRSKGVDAAVLADALRGLNSSRCNPPLPADEVEKLIRSVLSLPEGHSEAFKESKRQQQSGPEPKTVAEDKSVPAPKAEEPPDLGEDWQATDIEGCMTKRGKLVPHTFARELIDRDLVCHIDTPKGILAVWAGTRYDLGGDGVGRAIYRHHDAAGINEKREVLEHVRMKAPVRRSSPPDLLGFENGVLDLRTGKLRPMTPDDIIPNVIPHRYVGAREIDPKVDKMVTDAFWALADDDLTTYTNLWETVGLAMYRSNEFGQCPVLLGTGSNGKSAFLKIIKEVLGPDNYSALDLNEMGKSFQLDEIAGKLANIGDDIANGFLAGDVLAYFKKVATGDDVHTDVKYEKGYSFRPYCTLIFSCNEFPRLGDSSYGMLRRLFPIAFKRTFRQGDEGYDPHFVRKMTTEPALEAVIKHAVDKLKAFVGRGGFTRSETAEQIIADIEENSDSVAQWLREEDVTREDLLGKSIPDKYQSYTDFCKAAGCMPAKRSEFTKRIKAKYGLGSGTGRDEGNIVRVFKPVEDV